VDQKGGWQYIAHHKDDTASVHGSLPNRTMSTITHQAVDNARKTLGVVSCPSGNSNGSLYQMKEKAQKWLDSLTANAYIAG
jgi:hypothetical protein